MDYDSEKAGLERRIAGIAERKVERAPGTEGIWTFVFIDMLVFFLIFFAFMTDRLAHYPLYHEAQGQLNPLYAFANTLILLTSSWLVVEAIGAAKARQPRKVRRLLQLALALGAAFAINKIFEYHHEIASGVTVVGNAFFSFYFFITFAHFLHVLAGMLFLFAYSRSTERCLYTERYVIGLENVGLFWHYVDVLWIFIFPTLYLI